MQYARGLSTPDGYKGYGFEQGNKVTRTTIKRTYTLSQTNIFSILLCYT